MFFWFWLDVRAVLEDENTRDKVVINVSERVRRNEASSAICDAAWDQDGDSLKDPCSP